ncbi:MAG TPA: aromatic amino acid lyase, partial [Steroidobacteraceae bacterium]|nr:aromatic amino acid lyase [Steroidobacteraceae bacterium]
MTTADQVLSGRDLALDTVATLTAGARFRLTGGAHERMQASRRAVEQAIARGQTSYGITTGFGVFANKRIPADKLLELQRNLVRSHAAGVGAPLAAEHVRRILLLKANNLAAGHSGIRPVVVDALLKLLEHDVLPLIPGKGSVGASGDLAPLAHLSLALIGEGSATGDGRRLEGPAVCEAAGFAPFTLAAKEGLALLNGTQVSTALALHGLFAAQNLLAAGLVAGAMSVDAAMGSDTPFDARIHELRGQPGQIQVAALFRKLLAGSRIRAS